MKSLVYSLSIFTVFSAITVMWMTNFFTHFGESAGKPLMPVVWGIVLFAALFEPFMLTDFIGNRTKAMTYSSLVLRGIFAGAIICASWACLYLARRSVANYEWVLVAFGYGLALVIGALGVVLSPSSARIDER